MVGFAFFFISSCLSSAPTSSPRILPPFWTSHFVARSMECSALQMDKNRIRRIVGDVVLSIMQLRGASRPKDGSSPTSLSASHFSLSFCLYFFHLCAFWPHFSIVVCVCVCACDCFFWCVGACVFFVCVCVCQCSCGTSLRLRALYPLSFLFLLFLLFGIVPNDSCACCLRALNSNQPHRSGSSAEDAWSPSKLQYSFDLTVRDYPHLREVCLLFLALFLFSPLVRSSVLLRSLVVAYFGVPMCSTDRRAG